MPAGPALPENGAGLLQAGRADPSRHLPRHDRPGSAGRHDRLRPEAGRGDRGRRGVGGKRPGPGDDWGLLDWDKAFWVLLHGDLHLRPWEVRRLAFPSELNLALDHERHDPKKPPPGSEAVGHAAV